MNRFFAFLAVAYILAIFFLADSGAASRIGQFNPYSLLHIPLYGILTLLILLSLTPGNGSLTLKRWLAAAILAGFVGALDEFHQTFIPRREGSFGDVLLDLLGIGIALVIFHRYFPALQKKFGWGTRKG